VTTPSATPDGRILADTERWLASFHAIGRRTDYGATCSSIDLHEAKRRDAVHLEARSLQDDRQELARALYLRR